MVPPPADLFSAQSLTFPALSWAAPTALPRRAAEILNISSAGGNIPPLNEAPLCPGSHLPWSHRQFFCGDLGWGQGVLKR